MTDEEFREGLDGLFAHDTGCVDSGIKDERLREQCRQVLVDHADDAAWLTRLIREMWMSEDAVAAGYGIGDALSFVGWLSDRMEFDLGVD